MHFLPRGIIVSCLVCISAVVVLVWSEHVISGSSEGDLVMWTLLYCACAVLYLIFFTIFIRFFVEWICSFISSPLTQIASYILISCCWGFYLSDVSWRLGFAVPMFVIGVTVFCYVLSGILFSVSLRFFKDNNPMLATSGLSVGVIWFIMLMVVMIPAFTQIPSVAARSLFHAAELILLGSLTYAFLASR